MTVNAITPYQKMSDVLKQNVNWLKTFTPQANRILTSAMNACRTRPKLLECAPQSMLTALIQCAQYDIEPDSPLQQAHLVPYKSEVKLIIGYRGLITLAYRNTMIDLIEPNVVRAGDEFEYRHTQDGTILNHVENLELDRTDGSLFRAVYAMIFLRGSTKALVRAMTKDQVDAIMRRSPAYQRDKQSPWTTDYDAMAIKTVLKNAIKYIPLSVEQGDRLASVVQHDNQTEAGIKSASEAEAEAIVKDAVDAGQLNLEIDATATVENTDHAEETN